ncbi:hypothetical protein [Vibrio owensii]|uniref:hypothetical protein n=1 Tax=Vibrio harveyi group TaxID=717610 RepID=UPI003CC61A41
MSTKFIYRVVQVDHEGNLCSGLTTESALIALADFLTKARRPTKNVAARTLENAHAYCDIQQTGKGGLGKNAVNMRLNVHHKITGEIISRTIIKTLVIEESTEINDTFEEYTESFYQSSSYISALEAVAEKLYRWCASDMSSARILVAMAGMDPEHAFWDPGKWSDKKKELKP